MKVRAKNYRIYLSTPGIKDVSAIVRNANDAEVVKNAPGMPSPYTAEHALALVEFSHMSLVAGNAFHMGVYIANGTLIGMCALANLDRDSGSAELGYWIGKEYRNKGYAKEAVRTIIGFGFRFLDLNSIYASVLRSNVKSVALLESLGFRKSNTTMEEVRHGNPFAGEESLIIMKGNSPFAADITVTHD